MSAYVTFLIIVSILVLPISFIVALIVKLTGIKRIYREMVWPDNISIEEESVIDTLRRKNQKKRRERIENTIIAVISVLISMVLAGISIYNLYF